MIMVVIKCDRQRLIGTYTLQSYIVIPMRFVGSVSSSGSGAGRNDGCQCLLG